MNTESCDCRRVEFGRPAETVDQPGDFCWGDEREDGSRRLYIVLPGEKSMDAIKVIRGEPGGERVWGWDGNEDKPTLKPSIHSPDVWHGHLVSGRLVSC